MTAAIPASALGALTAHVEKPKIFTNIAGIQYEPGILSRVTVPAGSRAPKMKFERDLLMETAIAA